MFYPMISSLITRCHGSARVL